MAQHGTAVWNLVGSFKFLVGSVKYISIKIYQAVFVIVLLFANHVTSNEVWTLTINYKRQICSAVIESGKVIEINVQNTENVKIECLEAVQKYQI